MIPDQNKFPTMLELIDREANERTGKLDLMSQNLTEFPDLVHDLTHLRWLNLANDWHNEFEDIDEEKFSWSFGGYNSFTNGLPPIHLPKLEILSLNRTSLAELPLLKESPELRKLRCTDNPLNDLIPIKYNYKLRFLDFSDTQVQSLYPLLELTHLNEIVCCNTPISDLTPLSRLCELQRFTCHSTSVKDLTPLADLPSLEILQCSFCKLDNFPTSLLFNSALKELYLEETTVPGVPFGVLSQHSGDNCLHRLRAHVKDLKAGTDTFVDNKVIVLGNGRIGKTQICNRLCGKPYIENADSTHGILVNETDLALYSDSEDSVLSLWDFGGQELYHGTHAIFLKSRSIFVLVWTPTAENTLHYVHDGVTYRNQPLCYWLDFIRYTAGHDCPVIVIQNKCDTPDLCHNLPPDLLKGFNNIQEIQYSAKEDHNRKALNQALKNAANWLQGRESISVIGKGRMKVRRRIQQMLKEDQQRLPTQRLHRLMTQDEYSLLCEEAGGISSPKFLLEYLHNAGVIFYRPGLFNDRILIDLNWMLEAIYAVHHRQKCRRSILNYGGRFTPTALNDWIWEESGYTEAEQKLFLDMMQECGICFLVHYGISSEGIETEYAATDLLPERDQVVRGKKLLLRRWDDEEPFEKRTWRIEFFVPGAMRTLLSAIGRRFGAGAVYWRTGAWFADEELKSEAVIDQELSSESQGRIVLRTQGKQRKAMLASVASLIENVLSRFSQRMFLTEADSRTLVELPHEWTTTGSISPEIPETQRKDVKVNHRPLLNDRQQRIVKWFEPLEQQSGWVHWLTFWTIGYCDYDSLRNTEEATGHKNLIEVRMPIIMNAITATHSNNDRYSSIRAEVSDLLHMSESKGRVAIKHVTDYLKTNAFYDGELLLKSSDASIKTAIHRKRKTNGGRWTPEAWCIWSAMTVFLRHKNVPKIQWLIASAPQT